MVSSVISLGSLPATATNKMAGFKSSIGSAVDNVRFFNNSGSSLLNAGGDSSSNAAGTFGTAAFSSLDGIKLAQGELTELSHDLQSHENLLKFAIDKSFQDKIEETTKGIVNDAIFYSQFEKINNKKLNAQDLKKIISIPETNTFEATNKMLKKNEDYNIVCKAVNDIFDNIRALEDFTSQSCYQFASMKNEAEQKQFDAMTSRKLASVNKTQDNSNPKLVNLNQKA